MSSPVSIMDGRAISRSLARMAHEIVEAVGDHPRLAFVGIHRGGVPLSRRLAEAVRQITQQEVPTGSVDITLYRDDLYTGLERPVLGDTDFPFKVTGSGVVLVDDVLFTGRTVRAALDEIIDFGRPDFIRMAVLIDRGHRELPIAADFVGRSVEFSKTARVDVRLTELDADADEVVVLEEEGA